MEQHFCSFCHFYSFYLHGHVWQQLRRFGNYKLCVLVAHKEIEIYAEGLGPRVGRDEIQAARKRILACGYVVLHRCFLNAMH